MAEEEDEYEEIAEYGEIADANTELILTSPGYDGTTKYDTELDQVHLSNILSFFGSTNILFISGEHIRGRLLVVVVVFMTGERLGLVLMADLHLPQIFIAGRKL